MTRSAPLPASERRAAIMAATERLLVERGKDVTTRMIAEAAGIAEGTIFRVFPSKEALIDAIFEDAMDPEFGRAEFEALQVHEDLQTCLIELVKLLQRRISRVLALVGAVGFRRPLSMEDAQERRQRSFEQTIRVLRPHSGALRTGPDEAARQLHGMVLAATHPMFTDRPEADPEKIVDLALNGIGVAPTTRVSE